MLSDGVVSMPVRPLHRDQHAIITAMCVSDSMLSPGAVTQPRSIVVDIFSVEGEEPYKEPFVILLRFWRCASAAWPFSRDGQSEITAMLVASCSDVPYLRAVTQP
jgi:hypothetical protein